MVCANFTKQRIKIFEIFFFQRVKRVQKNAVVQIVNFDFVD